MAAITDSDKFRTNIIKRREGGGISIVGLSSTEGELTVDECMRIGFWKVNCKQLVGIATATEVGLTSDRFPLRFVIGDSRGHASGSIVCAGYWRITDAGGNFALFNKRGLPDDRPLRNLRKAVDEFDTTLWEVYREIADGIVEDDDAAKALYDGILPLLSVPEMTANGYVLIREAFNAIIANARAKKMVPRFKISNTLFLTARPAGSIRGTTADRTTKFAKETMLNMSVNEARMRARYPAVEIGTIALAAYTIAAVFRYGLYEHFASQEYYTVYVDTVENSNVRFTVREIFSPPGAPDVTGMAVGQILDISTVKMSRKMTELAPGLAIISGMNHYMLNHTTGGNVVSGSLLSFLAMTNAITSSLDRAQQEVITSVFYEVLHPVNKRAIANLFIPESLVTTHGKDRTAPAYEELDLDAFTRIRGRSNPAGSHKAVICATVLSRVIDAGLAPLLPWCQDISICIALCKEVMTNGARAHMGSDYYTGLPAQTQSSSLDRFLPELASYIGTFAKGDSLSFSPHLSSGVAASAALNWVSLLKELKAQDVSATSADVIRNFLAAAGKTYFTFDPTDEATWGNAILQAGIAKNALREFL